MKKQVQPYAVIFDMDGTLFQTEKVAVPAFHRTVQRLEKTGLYTGPTPTDEQVTATFGMVQEEIWERLLPDAEEQVREQADRWWLKHELECISEGMGELYPGVTEGIHELKKRGWALFVASNGLGPYVRGILDFYGLSEFFTGVYTAGDYHTARKEDLVQRLIESHGVQQGYMVGDRSSDVRAGKANGLTVIGCRYAGYPQFSAETELAEADVIADSFSAVVKTVGSPR
jgi:phosphoglycolate phosphatase